nr:helix-turn-helix domain-containing protein [Pantoea agglomerans]
MKLSAPAFRLPGSCGLAQQKDKGRIVRQMQGKGLFIVRGGVEMAARGLGVTRYSVCNYLDEIKKTP